MGRYRRAFIGYQQIVLLLLNQIFLNYVVVAWLTSTSTCIFQRANHNISVRHSLEVEQENKNTGFMLTNAPSQRRGMICNLEQTSDFNSVPQSMTLTFLAFSLPRRDHNKVFTLLRHQQVFKESMFQKYPGEKKNDLETCNSFINSPSF